MRKLVVPAIFVALLAMGSLAQAAQHAKGSIESIDPATRILTLNDGTTFTLAKKVDESAFKIGDKVKVGFETADGANTATAVKKVQ